MPEDWKDSFHTPRRCIAGGELDRWTGWMRSSNRSYKESKLFTLSDYFLVSCLITRETLCLTCLQHVLTVFMSQPTSSVCSNLQSRPLLWLEDSKKTMVLINVASGARKQVWVNQVTVVMMINASSPPTQHVTSLYYPSFSGGQITHRFNLQLTETKNKLNKGTRIDICLRAICARERYWPVHHHVSNDL